MLKLEVGVDYGSYGEVQKNINGAEATIPSTPFFYCFLIPI